MASERAGRLMTGVPAMDDEHWGLVTLLAQLRAAVGAAAPPTAIAALVGRLHHEAAEHFATEERLMHERRYPMADSHVAQHHRFLAELSRWTASTGAPAAPPPITAPDVDRLEAWFARHVELADAPLADWLLHPRD